MVNAIHVEHENYAFDLAKMSIEDEFDSSVRSRQAWLS
jgi:hypothetical protein